MSYVPSFDEHESYDFAAYDVFEVWVVEEVSELVVGDDDAIELVARLQQKPVVVWRLALRYLRLNTFQLPWLLFQVYEIAL